jgi:hypothetical protein
MGFYIRKSVKVGPLRFNLSKTGLGVSTGVKGFRVGTGPRGNYVQMGFGGVYFRQTIPSGIRTEVPSNVPENRLSDLNLQRIESGSVTQMVDSSSEELLKEINSKSKKPLIWPWILTLSLCLLFVCAIAGLPPWIYLILTPLCGAGLFCALYADKLRKTVVLFYKLEPHIEEAYQQLHDAFNLLERCSRIWHIQSRGNITTTYDWKVNAGASAVVNRKIAFPRTGAPSYFQCNISIPVLPVSGRRLYFLPDRILVWGADGVGAVGFDQLHVDFREQRFIEDGGVPADSRVVDKTWKYVNKKGGPDKRFNDNREIPIVLYEGLMLTSKSGLQELFHIPKTGTGSVFNSAVKRLSLAISQRGKSDAESDYIKCPCNNCDVMIEFPKDGVGQTVICPHCQMETSLFQPG